MDGFGKNPQGGGSPMLLKTNSVETERGSAWIFMIGR